MSDLAHATFRGVVGAMAMTGVRVFAAHAGLIRKQASGLLRSVPRERRRPVVELVHWGMGAAFGALYGLLPDSVRQRRWTGPLFGVVVWLGFDRGVAPLLGLTEAEWPKGRERAVFVADHVLFGLVLDETRARPRE